MELRAFEHTPSTYGGEAKALLSLPAGQQGRGASEVPVTLRGLVLDFDHQKGRAAKIRQAPGIDRVLDLLAHFAIARRIGDPRCHREARRDCFIRTHFDR